MSIKEDIQRFYKQKSNKDRSDYFDYDQEGNMVEYNKVQGQRGEIIKTIVLPTYGPATMEELKDDEAQYQRNLQQAIQDFDRARRELYDEFRSNHKTNESVLLLQQKVAEADKKMIAARFRNYYIRVVSANDKDTPADNRIKMRQLYFEQAIQDKNVYDDIAMIETQVHPLQRLFKVTSEPTVPISVANKQAIDNKKNIEKANTILKANGIEFAPKRKKKASGVPAPSTTNGVPAPSTTNGVPAPSTTKVVSNALSSLSNTITSALGVKKTEETDVKNV